MRTAKRMHPVLMILAVLAVAMGLATASIQPVHASDGSTACDNGDRSPDCGGLYLTR